MKILKPEVSTGYSNNQAIKDALLDTSTFYRTPEKAMPKLVALVSDYAADEKYFVGKRFFVDAVFDHQLTYEESIKVKWDIQPKENFRFGMVCGRPDARTVRQEIIPTKAGNIVIKASYTDKKGVKTEMQLVVKPESLKATADSLRTVQIINMEYVSKDVTDTFLVNQDEEVKVYFDSIMENEKGFSIITSENIVITKEFKLAEDRKSGTFTFACKEAGKGSIQVCTTGTPYVGFFVPVEEAPAELELVSISEPLEVIKGQQVKCVLTFNNFLLEVPADLKVTLNNANVKEVKKEVLDKTITITYEGMTEGVTQVTAQLGDATPSKSCNITVQKEATQIATATPEKAEVPVGEDVGVSAEFDEYPVQDKVKITASPSALTKKGKPVINGKKATQEFIPNIPGRHKINVAYEGIEGSKEVEVVVQGRVPGKEAEETVAE